MSGQRLGALKLLILNLGDLVRNCTVCEAPWQRRGPKSQDHYSRPSFEHADLDSENFSWRSAKLAD